MLFSYFKVAARHFTRQKRYFALNVIGLSIGLAAAMLTAFYVLHELSYDLQQPNANVHYRVVMHAQENGNEYLLSTPRAKEPLLAISGIDAVYYLFNTRMGWDGKVALGDDYFQLSAHYAVSSNITQLVKLDVLVGDLQNVLQQPNTLALSKREALRLFGQRLPLNQIVGQTLRNVNSSQLISIAAIFDDLPETSHFAFDSLQSIQPFEQIRGNAMHTYVQIPIGSDLSSISEQVSAVFRSIWQWENVSYRLQPLRDVHLGSNYREDMKMGGSKQAVVICGVLSALLVLISIVNYVNFATAQQVVRVKTMQVRKALGSTRLQLAMQFLVESLMTTVLAMIIACAIVESSLPYFANLVGREIANAHWLTLILPLLVLTLLVALLVGVYPSWVIARIKTTSLLNDTQVITSQSTRLRKTLLCFQMMMSIGLIIGAQTVRQQLDYLQHLPRNYETEQQLVVSDLPYGSLYDVNALDFYQTLEQHEGVESVTVMDFDLTQATNAGLFIQDPNKPTETLSFALAGVTMHVANTLGLELIAGRDFNYDTRSDWFSRARNAGSLIIPESALPLLGFSSATEAVGKTVLFSGGPIQKAQGLIVGVVKDIKIGDVNYHSAPIVFACGLGVGGRYSLIVKHGARPIHEVKDAIAQHIFQRLGIAPVAITHLADDYRALYQEGERLAKVIQIASGLSIGLILLGIFGITGLITEQKRKEIAIRKVLGASSTSLVNYFAKEFAVLLAVSTLLAFPLAYWLLERWLSEFNLHINQLWWSYLGAASLVAGLTWLTVAGLVLKTAQVKPGSELRVV